MISEKTRNFLLKKRATPTEWRLYCEISAFKQPFQNGEALERFGTSRTNVHQHLSRMIDKGLVIRHSYKTYLPAIPK